MVLISTNCCSSRTKYLCRNRTAGAADLHRRQTKKTENLKIKKISSRENDDNTNLFQCSRILITFFINNCKHIGNVTFEVTAVLDYLYFQFVWNSMVTDSKQIFRHNIHASENVKHPVIECVERRFECDERTCNVCQYSS